MLTNHAVFSGELMNGSLLISQSVVSLSSKKYSNWQITMKVAEHVLVSCSFDFNDQYVLSSPTILGNQVCISHICRTALKECPSRLHFYIVLGESNM